MRHIKAPPASPSRHSLFNLTWTVWSSSADQTLHVFRKCATSQNPQPNFNNSSRCRPRSHFHNLLWYCFLWEDKSRPCELRPLFPSQPSWRFSFRTVSPTLNKFLKAEAKGRTSRCFLALYCFLVRLRFARGAAERKGARVTVFSV